MTNEQATAQAIEAFANLAPVVIHTDADFTPAGPRMIRIVQLARCRFGSRQQLRFYVSGRIFREMAVTPENLAMGRAWQKA